MVNEGNCRRGCGLPGSFIHIIWECVIIQSYWSKVHDCMSTVLGIVLQPETKRCLLNVWEPTDLTSKDKIWATLGQMVAKWNIAQMWGAGEPPRVKSWKADMDWCMFREKTVYVSRGCPKKLIAIWNKWNVYCGNICIPPSVPKPDDPITP